MLTRDKIYSLIDGARVVEDETERAAEIERIIGKLTESFDVFEDKSEFYYLIGYTWYNHPFETAERNYGIKYHLEESIKIQDDNQFSRLFLGHYYFDSNKYEEAITQFEKLDLKYFQNMDQKWRVLKIRELIEVSKLILNPDVSKDKILEIIQDYLNLEDSERAVPTELINTIYTLYKDYRLKIDSKDLILKLKRLIANLEMEELFEEESKFFTKLLSSG